MLLSSYSARMWRLYGAQHPTRAGLCACAPTRDRWWRSLCNGPHRVAPNSVASQGTACTHAPLLPTDAGDPYSDLKNRFGIAKQVAAASAVAQGAQDGGASAVADAYHAGLVPPFCLAAVRSFFASR